MLYRQFGDKQLSLLGMGAMRLPTTEHRGPIDEELVFQMVDYAYKNGINYFDTAFRYHGGHSEVVLGKALSRYPRDTWYLATKFPGHMFDIEEDKLVFRSYGGGASEYYNSVGHIFETQLDRCGVDYFDFYLLHNVSEGALSYYEDEELGIFEYLVEQKKAGRIKHLGFSTHGRPETVARMLEKWKEHIEFVQIQINYLDWTLQDAKSKYEIIASHGIPVIAMEPVRGGRLASLPIEAESILKAIRPNDTPASWGLRYLQALDNIPVILSGMSNMEQLVENIQTLSNDDPVTDRERLLLNAAVGYMTDMVPCTACEYCLEKCPANLEIAKLISIYNEAKTDGIWSVGDVVSNLAEDELPDACERCGECANVCPQSIDVPKVMEEFGDLIANPPPRRR
ncbi:MAG: aldo/keto reductase [Eubacteriaceae bacterium]|nr:aldo/keto reductase [Eubacteriaceae bacterium]